MLFSSFLSAQNGSSSPYSFYGIGESKFKDVYENRNMGGLGVFADSIHLNLQNPAANAALRLTTFTVGTSNNRNTIKSNTGEAEVQRTTLDFIAVGLPLGKLGMNFGLMPFSSVGYKNRNTFIENNQEKTQIFEGKGGINRTFVSFGYEISSTIAVGLSLNYDFGNIETKNSEYFTGVESGSRELDASRLSGFTSNIGVMFKKPLNKKLMSYGSFTYTPESKLKTTNSRTLSTVGFSSVLGELLVDSEQIIVPSKSIIVPSKISIGAGLGETNKWMAGAQFTTQLSGTFENRFNDIQNVTYESAYQISVGGFFVPKYNSFNNYFNRITYRAGFRYDNTGLIIQNQSITDFGTTFGLGLPLGGPFSKVNLGFEFGKRGTLNQNLVEEKYYNISIGFTINDKWFQKIKYD